MKTVLIVLIAWFAASLLGAALWSAAMFYATARRRRLLAGLTTGRRNVGIGQAAIWPPGSGITTRSLVLLSSDDDRRGWRWTR